MNRISHYSLKWIIILFSIFTFSSCYTVKNKNDDTRINIQFFKNETNIYGIENELSSALNTTLRHETNFRTGNSDFGYIIKGKILDYKKKVIRKASNGDPTHQQVFIEVQMEFYENDKVLYTQKLTNIAYRIDSGLYNITAGENEAFGRAQALRDLSEAIAVRVNYYFLGN